MNICLIKPPILHKGVSFARFATPPLGLAYIAAALQNSGHQIQVIDASAEGINEVERFANDVYLFGLNSDKIIERIEKDTQIICLSLMFTNNWLYDRELIKKIKAVRPNTVIIGGGEHATAMPKLCFQQSPIDYIVLGEGESIVVELVATLENKGKIDDVSGIAYRTGADISLTQRKKRIANIQDIPRPAWDLFPLQDYFDNRMTHGVYRGRTLPVNATRGCPYECTFCSNPLMWGRKYEMRPITDFVDELEHLHHKYSVVNFELCDLTAIVKKDWIVAMCQEIIRRGLQITYQLPSGTRAEAIDFEVSELLYKSGCKNITYAPESGSEKVLYEVKKKVKVSKMLDSIRHSSKAGLNVKLNMIMGFPNDFHSDIWRTYWFLIQCSWYGANDAAPAIFSPYPGSKLFDDLVSEKKIFPEEDRYLFDIINTYDLVPATVYSQHISSRSIRIYIVLFLLIFYGSNYMFRPQRLFRTLLNILSNREESKIEQLVLSNVFFPLKIILRKKIAEFRKPNPIR